MVKSTMVFDGFCISMVFYSESSALRLGSLLALGFGEAGADIIGTWDACDVGKTGQRFVENEVPSGNFS